MNYRVISHTLGWVAIVEAACMALPLICAAIYGEACIKSFAICILLCLAVGFLLTRGKIVRREMYARDGFVTVAASWIMISILGAMPFMLILKDFAFADALFETVSGFTTTGASILNDVEALPKSLLFWRSFTHWIGGMGVLVFLVALLPLSGGTNMYLIKAESPGPSVSKLVPKVRSTAKILYLIYIFMTAVQIILLLIGGMKPFDALTLSFGTAVTGGFGIKNSSIADYSTYSQWVITIFMILFGIDFSVYHSLFIRRFSSAIRSEEVRVYLLTIAAATAVIMYNCRGLFEGFFDALRHSAFQVASVITTTGYSTADFDKWPELSKTVLLLLMFIGACAGSTGGGIKVSRVIVMFKSIVKEVKIAAHPKSTHKLQLSGRPVEHETQRSINVFFAAYIVIYVVSLLVISIDNFDFTTNFSAVVATFNNIGPGFSKVGPTMNFSAYSTLSKVVLTFDMLAGRLEIFPLLVFFAPYTWKK